MGQPELSETFDAASLQGLDDVFSAAPVLEPVTSESEPVPAPVLEPVTSESEPVPAPVLEPVTSESEPVPAPVLEPVTIPIEQAASILGTSVAALKKRLRRGSVRGTKAESKHGEKWFVDASELPTEPIPAPVTSELKQVPEPVTNESEPVPAPVLEPVTGELEPVPEPDTVDVEPVPELTPYNAEYQRLMSIIESQAHQLKAAGDVIVYLRSEVDDAKSQVKLLTDSQHKPGWWVRFCSWFSPRP